MIVWAGCVTCRHDPRARKWEGLWVDAEVYPTLTVYDIHQPGYLPDIDDHVIKAYTLDDWIPRERTEETLSWQAGFMEKLDGYGMSEPVTVFSILKGVEPWEVDADEFLARYVGTWYGRPSRAARKRYIFIPTTPGAYFIFKREYVRPASDAVRRAVQV